MNERAEKWIRENTYAAQEDGIREQVRAAMRWAYSDAASVAQAHDDDRSEWTIETQIAMKINERAK